LPNKPKGQRCRQDVLTPEEMKSMLRACQTDRERFSVACLMYGGLRVSELVHLRKHWVDFDEGTIQIPMTQTCSCVECTNKRQGLWKPKTARGARTIRIHPILKPILEQYMAGHDGIDIGRIQTWRIVKRIAEDAIVLHSVYPHCMRATAASGYAFDGISAASLRYLFGWSRLSSAEAYVQSDRKRALAEQEAVHAHA